MSAYWKLVWVLFGIFVAANLAFLHRVPGLMGDEASEGENVYELLRSEKIVVQGERSYIGPLIDYIRAPFIEIFGYTPLALRLVVILASFAAFWLAACVLREVFGDEPALGAIVLGFFNPMYLSQERIGWAIALFPFFFFLILWLLVGPPYRQASAGRPVRAVLAGLVAGIGLSNHILFMPTLVAAAGVGVLVLWLRRPLVVRKKVFSTVLAFLGFAAGFALQFWVLLTYREDQGDVVVVAQSFWERASDLPQLLPLVLSGSSYVARYTGVEFAPSVIWMITGILIFLAAAALFFSKQRKLAWFWILGMAIHLAVLMYMIDRFTLRYFVMFVFAAWMLAGAGLGILAERVLSRFHPHQARVGLPAVRLAGGPQLATRAESREAFAKWDAKSPKSVWLRSLSVVITALLLVLWATLAVLIPFLKTGGSTADFSLGNRTDSAAALVDTRPLIECLRGAGSVSSENVHIWNRLQFLSHQYSDLMVVPQDDRSHAKWLVHYRDAKQPEAGGFCPQLAHFRVVAT